MADMHADPAWPSLDGLALPETLAARRRRGVGGSDANIILSGDSERILRLWREKRGEGEGEDLSAILPVMLGSWTEAFNRQWYQQTTGWAVTQVGSLWTSADHSWRLATLDGMVDDKAAVFEAKHVSAFAKPDEVLARYMPQLQHNMAVTGLDRAILSVIYGNHKWDAYEIERDWLYQDELLVAEQRFWNAVHSGELPIAAVPPEPPKPTGYRELDMTGSNAWAAASADWIATALTAKTHAASTKALKELIPGDVSRAFGTAWKPSVQKVVRSLSVRWHDGRRSPGLCGYRGSHACAWTSWHRQGEDQQRFGLYLPRHR